MLRNVTVRTPESIGFSYELAGLGSRFLAVAIDFAIQFALAAAIFTGLAMAGSHASSTRGTAVPTERWAESVAIAMITAIVFLIFFGYFILFEALWNGRTPGKWMMALRAVRDGGYPLDFMSSLIRNLVRVGEVALGLYAISAIVCVASKENKRLGDYAAGTIVVRDAPVAALAGFVAQANAEPLPGIALTTQERAVIAQFLQRRSALEPMVRMRLAMRLADHLRPRLPAEYKKMDDEELLGRLSAS